MSCGVGEVIESLENELCYDYNYELCSFSKLSVTSPTSQLILILQAFRHFTYVTAHSPILPSLYLRHNSFSNPSVASPTSQHNLQPFFRLSYVTGFSLTSPDEPPMGRPSVSEENVEAISALLDTDRRLTVRELALEIGLAHMTVFRIVKKRLGMRKIASRWVPWDLTEVQRWLRYDSPAALWS